MVGFRAEPSPGPTGSSGFWTTPHLLIIILWSAFLIGVFSGIEQQRNPVPASGGPLPSGDHDLPTSAAQLTELSLRWHQGTRQLTEKVLKIRRLQKELWREYDLAVALSTNKHRPNDIDAPDEVASTAVPTPETPKVKAGGKRDDGDGASAVPLMPCSASSVIAQWDAATMKSLSSTERDVLDAMSLIELKEELVRWREYQAQFIAAMEGRNDTMLYNFL